MFTLQQVHFKDWKVVAEQRQRVLEKAAKDNPERFVRGIPKVKKVPEKVWINKPEKITTKCPKAVITI